MKVIKTTNAPGAVGPYSQAIEIDNLVFASGQIALDPATGEMAEGIEAQAHQALKNGSMYRQNLYIRISLWQQRTMFRTM